MDMWFWLLLTDFVIAAIAYYWGHWNGYGKGEEDANEWHRDLAQLTLNYIVAREDYHRMVEKREAEDILSLYEMEMFKHLVNLANYIKFEMPEYREVMESK